MTFKRRLNYTIFCYDMFWLSVSFSFPLTPYLNIMVCNDDSLKRNYMTTDGEMTDQDRHY